MNAKATTSASPELVQFRVESHVASQLLLIAKRDGRSRSNLLAKIATDYVRGDLVATNGGNAAAQPQTACSGQD